MKHKMPKKPTRAQKEIIEKVGYRWNEWLVLSEGKLSLFIEHKVTGQRKVIAC